MRTTGTTITTTTLGEAVQAFLPRPLPPADPPLAAESHAAGNHRAEMALARLAGSRLRAREDVLGSFEEHVRFVGARRLSVAKFAELMNSVTVDGKPALIVASALRAA